MSRSPDYDTPVEMMESHALIENALAMHKEGLFEMDRGELMAENVRLGAAQYQPATCMGCGGAIIPPSLMFRPLSFIPENGLCNRELPECNDTYTHVFMCLSSGIPDVILITESEEKCREVWIDQLRGDECTTCDEKGWSIEEGYEKGYFVNHKDEYRILVHKKEVEN